MAITPYSVVVSPISFPLTEVTFVVRPDCKWISVVVVLSLTELVSPCGDFYPQLSLWSSTPYSVVVNPSLLMFLPSGVCALWYSWIIAGCLQFIPSGSPFIYPCVGNVVVPFDWSSLYT